MKRNVVLGIIGGTVLVAGAVVAYIKRDAIREAKNDIIADVKRLLKKEKPEIAAKRSRSEGGYAARRAHSEAYRTP